MSASVSVASNVLQNFDTSVTYIEQFDLSPCCVFDDEKGVCLASEGINVLMSNMARMLDQGWRYMHTTQDPNDDTIYRIHYQSPLC